MARFTVALFTLLAAVGLVSAPASAEFTPTEKTSVQMLLWAAYGNRAGDPGSLADGNSGVLDLILRDATNAATRAPLAALKHLVRQAQYELGMAALELSGANMPSPAVSRSAAVDRAKARVTKVKTVLLPQILVAADSVKAAGAGGTYPATIDRYKSGNLGGVVAKLNAFRMDLAYADPYPPGRSKAGDRITVIGPHGDYVRSQSWLVVALDRMNFMYAAAIDGYAADALLPSYWNKYQQLKFINLVLSKIGVAVGTLSGMQFSGYPTDPFFRVLSLMEQFTHGGGGPVTAANDCSPDFCHALSYDFNNLMLFTQADAGQEATRPTFAAKQRKVLSEITEAWQATDSALWYMLKFPECETTGGCGGR